MQTTNNIHGLTQARVAFWKKSSPTCKKRHAVTTLRLRKNATLFIFLIN